MLDWILTPQHVRIVLIALALIMPAVGWLVHRRTGKIREAKALGVSGLLMLVLWFAFNSIEDFFGLDSWLALGLNAILFLSIGLVVGLWIKQKG